MRGRYPWIVIFVDAVDTVGFTGGADLEKIVFFRVAVEEEVDGGEAETLLTTEETTERSTGQISMQVDSKRIGMRLTLF